MSNLFYSGEMYGGESVPELEVYDHFEYVDDAEEALIWYKDYRADGIDHQEAMRLVIEEVVPSTFLQTLADRSLKQQSN